MPINQDLNTILKQMWQIDERICSGETISEVEKNFFNDHLSVIQKYYEEKNTYWIKRQTYNPL